MTISNPINQTYILSMSGSIFRFSVSYKKQLVYYFIFIYNLVYVVLTESDTQKLQIKTLLISLIRVLQLVLTLLGYG